jgi:DNA-binding XRE family transcriptional regulator
MLMSDNNGNGSATHFGRQIRKERLGRGWSIHELAQRTGLNAGYLSRIENGKRPPTLHVARACDAVFPERRGWFTEYYEDSREWTPPGFRSWSEYEDVATSVRAWSPGVLDGFVQTEAYARALLKTALGATPEIVSTRLAARMERQRRVVFRDDPPTTWLVVDELSLYRDVGGPEVMADQMRHLSAVATLPHTTLQILPAVAHPANVSQLIVANSAAYVEHLVGGYVYTDEPTVSSLLRLFSTVQAECYKASESLALIDRTRDRWATGGSPLTATPTAEHA